MTWPTKKLGEVAEFQKGKLMPNSAVRTEGVTPYILIDDLRSNGYSHFTPSNHGTACLPSDILLVWDGANAGTVGGGLTGFVGSTITKVSPAEEIDPEFLRIILSSKFSEFNKQVHGAAIPHLNKDFVSNLPVFIPPMNVQKQIVERMDKIAEAQKLNDELIQKADELFQSFLHKELNPTNKNWEIKKLGEISEINPSKTETNGLPDDLEIGFLTMADVSEDAEMINVQTRKLKEAKRGFTYFRDGDVLFAKITPCMENGKGALAEGMKNGIGFGSTEFHVLRVKPEFVLNKLWYLIVNDKVFRKNAQKFMRGAVGQQRVPSDYLEKFKIPLPPIKLQQQIVEKLSAAQEYKNRLIVQKSKLKELFDSVLHKSMKNE